ncbi:MAG TPA: hypothetical protein VF135_10405 [Terriglobales bacterium]
MSLRQRIRNPFLLVSIFLLLCSAAPSFAQRFSSESDDLDQLLASKESGLLTDWRLIGPYGKTADTARIWPPEKDQMRRNRYGERRVVTLEFATGKFELPARISRQGIFYAASEVWVPNGGEWRIYAETAGIMTVFVDGKSALRREPEKSGGLEMTSQVVHLERGTHRVLVKFTAAAAPFHLAVMPQTGGLRKRNNKPVLHTSEQAEYTSAHLDLPQIP